MTPTEALTYLRAHPDPEVQAAAEVLAVDNHFKPRSQTMRFDLVTRDRLLRTLAEGTSARQLARELDDYRKSSRQGGPPGSRAALWDQVLRCRDRSISWVRMREILRDGDGSHH